MTLLEEVYDHAPRHPEKTTGSKIQSPYRPTTSPTIARHVQRRAEGQFSTPKQELYAIDRLVDSGDLLPEERSWANSRRKELLRKINEPTIKERMIGLASRRLDAEEVERSGHYDKMKSIVNELHKTLDIAP